MAQRIFPLTPSPLHSWPSCGVGTLLERRMRKIKKRGSGDGHHPLKSWLSLRCDSQDKELLLPGKYLYNNCLQDKWTGNGATDVSSVWRVFSNSEKDVQIYAKKVRKILEPARDVLRKKCRQEAFIEQSSWTENEQQGGWRVIDAPYIHPSLLPPYCNNPSVIKRFALSLYTPQR